jgi:hypothetical protein
MTEQFAELERIRKKRDWTYLQLADAIEAVTRRRRDQDCWRRICLGLTETPNARTLDILEEYLASVSNGRKARRKVA